MSEQLAHTAVATADSEIEAEVAWTVSNRPPQVVLSFQGLHEPVELWEKLTAIGWIVPGMPPRPANAIEWTPDPVAGTDYTVLPWRVKEHRLEEGTWTIDEDKVGYRTLDALLDHEATIVGSSDQIAEHANLYEQRKAERARNATSPVPENAVDGTAATATSSAADPDLAPSEAPTAQTPDAPKLASSSTAHRIILLLDFPVDADPLPNAGAWKGISGQQKVQCTWSELSLPASDPIPGHAEMQSQVSGGASAWYADTETALAETAPDGMRIVRLFLPGLSVLDAKVRRMNKLLGENIESHQLHSLTGGDQSAVLVSATVGANSFEMLKSNLCLRMPKAVVRINA